MNTTKTGNNETDKELVNRILTGDSTAFATIIQNTEVLVTQIIFKMIANGSDRKDLAQDVYLKAYRNLQGFKFQSKLSTWMAQIAYNTCFDHLRKRKLVLADNLYGDNETSPAETVEADFPLQQKEMVQLLSKEIERLPPVFQTLITLYHREEMSYLEIGEITGLPEGTVKSYLFRARKMLKENLTRKYQKEDI